MNEKDLGIDVFLAVCTAKWMKEKGMNVQDVVNAGVEEKVIRGILDCTVNADVEMLEVICDVLGKTLYEFFDDVSRQDVSYWRSL